MNRKWDQDDDRLAQAFPLLGAGLERSEQWQALRRKGIGASDMAAVLGLSKYASPFSLYYEKTEDWLYEDDDPQDEPLTMRLGREDEIGIASIFGERYPGWRVRIPPGSLWRSRYQHAAWMLATPDRLLTLDVDDPIGDLLGEDFDIDRERLAGLSIPLEIKSLAGGYSGWGEPLTDQVPLQFAVQVIQQCLIFGAPFGVIACRIGKRIQEFVIHVDQHLELVAEMLRSGEKFMEYVRHNIEPAVDGHEATTDALRRLYPYNDKIDEDEALDQAVMIDRQTLTDLARLRRRIKEAKDQQESIRNQIRERLGSARYGVDSSGTVVARRTHYTRRSYSVREAEIDQINFVLPSGDDDE